MATQSSTASDLREGRLLGGNGQTESIEATWKHRRGKERGLHLTKTAMGTAYGPGQQELSHINLLIEREVTTAVKLADDKTESFLSDLDKTGMENS